MGLLSCDMTEPCACPPSRSHLVVSGTVTQGNQAVFGAKLTFQENVDGPCTSLQDRVYDLQSSFAEPLEVTTDDTGAFSAHVYSHFTPTERCVIVTGAADHGTVRVEQMARFRDEHKRPEAVQVDIILGAP